MKKLFNHIFCVMNILLYEACDTLVQCVWADGKETVSREFFFVLNRRYLKLKNVCFNNCISIHGRSYIFMLYPLFRLSKRLILLSIHAFNKPAVSIDKISCMVLKQVQFPQMKMFQNTQTSEFCYIWFYAAHTVIRCSF